MKNNWQKDIHDRLGNYEKDANVDMSLGNLLPLAAFYQYILNTQTMVKRHQK